MKKRKIRDLEVSEIGMGTMAFSHGYGKIPDHDYAVDAIRKAYDHGCTFFDTAEVYSPLLQGLGHNELIVGEALRHVSDDVVIATKITLTPEDYAPGVDLYEAVRKHLEASLDRLRISCADLYYLHRVNENVPVEDVAAVMGRLIDNGLIKSWGLSQVSLETLKKAHEVTPVTAVQNLYNILERDCEQDIFPYCMENNIGVVPFSPIASGFLSGRISADTEFEKVDDVRNWVPQLSRENITANQPVLDVLNEYAEKKNATPAQISLAWMLYKYPNVVPIPGSKNQGRILENLDAGKVEFTDSEFNALQSALDKIEVHGHRGHIEESAGGRVHRPHR